MSGRLAILALVVAGVAPACAGAPEAARRSEAKAHLAIDDRAVAMGRLLDARAGADAVDEGIRIADQLRRRYGIDSGDPQADRIEAARRARRELLDTLAVTSEDLAGAAESLGYSLAPQRCLTACENVRRLAILELQKRALRSFAASGERP